MHNEWEGQQLVLDWIVFKFATCSSGHISHPPARWQINRRNCNLIQINYLNYPSPYYSVIRTSNTTQVSQKINICQLYEIKPGSLSPRRLNHTIIFLKIYWTWSPVVIFRPMLAWSCFGRVWPSTSVPQLKHCLNPQNPMTSELQYWSSGPLRPGSLPHC